MSASSAAARPRQEVERSAWLGTCMALPARRVSSVSTPAKPPVAPALGALAILAPASPVASPTSSPAGASPSSLAGAQRKHLDSWQLLSSQRFRNQVQWLDWSVGLSCACSMSTVSRNSAEDRAFVSTTMAWGALAVDSCNERDSAPLVQTRTVPGRRRF